MDDPVRTDIPEVVAELRVAFERYEAALLANDLATMGELFWDDDRVVRFGIADQQVGARVLSQWRAGQGGLPPGRTLSETRITTFGTTAGVVTTVFKYPQTDSGVGRLRGRQSQAWARFADGWRVVSAHVSEVPEP